jgi:hypothetical protein
METPEKESGEVAQTANSVIGASATWAFLKENFSVISGLAVVAGLALAITFLFSYLSVFDWHLIVFIQYVDVITFGVIAVGVVSGSMAALINLLEAWVVVPASESTQEKRLRWLIVGCIAAALLGLALWGSIRSGYGYFHVLYGFLLFGIAVNVAMQIAAHARTRRRPTVRAFLNFAFFAFFGSAICGQWLGMAILEVSAFDQEIQTKTLTLSSAKLVIVLSRFSVFLKDKQLYVVPTADVAQFRTSRPLTTILPSSADSPAPPAVPAHSP